MLETMQPSTLALVVKWKIPSCSLVLAYPLYIGQHHSGYEICNSSTKISYPFTLKLRGHSTTTWTNFDPILTPSPPRVDKRGHSTYPPPCPRGQKGQWTKGAKKAPLPPEIFN